jgi:guanine deaminase
MPDSPPHSEPVDQQYMRMAIGLATGNVLSGAGGPFGAVIVKDGKVLATGVNQVTATNDPTAHAEVTAIRAAAAILGSYELQGCVIYSSCEPCPMCLGAIYWARIDALYFGGTAQDAADAGFDDSHFYDELRKPIAARSLRTINLMRNEAAEPFKAWCNSPAKIEY